MSDSLEYLPRLPQRKDVPIGCIGAGFIMRDCHLVAYRQAGFNPVAICSRKPSTAQSVADQHSIPVVCESWQELLPRPEIEVVDIAVPPADQPAIIREATKHSDHIRGILAQKPLAMTVEEAVEITRLCQESGIKLAVNQNMRFDQSVRACKDLLSKKWLGDPVLATIDMRAIPHWMPWSEGLRSLSTYIMSIHHLDTFRYWFGTPDRVFASTRSDPRTKFDHTDGINLYILEYENGLRIQGCDDVWTGPAREGADSDISIRWRIEGTEGTARGTIGWPSYPERTPSTIDFTTVNHPKWQKPRWDEVWFPDAFVGTMAQLLCALEEDTEPEIGAKDNLETLALCEAVLQSGREHQVIAMQPFLQAHKISSKLK